MKHIARLSAGELGLVMATKVKRPDTLFANPKHWQDFRDKSRILLDLAARHRKGQNDNLVNAIHSTMDAAATKNPLDIGKMISDG